MEKRERIGGKKCGFIGEFKEMGRLRGNGSSDSRCYGCHGWNAECGVLLKAESLNHSSRGQRPRNNGQIKFSPCKGKPDWTNVFG